MAVPAVGVGVALDLHDRPREVLATSRFRYSNRRRGGPPNRWIETLHSGPPCHDGPDSWKREHGCGGVIRRAHNMIDAAVQLANNLAHE
ncbi:hypothetical protein [Nocardia niigatensis]